MRAIVADVRTRRDAAVIDYARRFDRASATAVADLSITLDEARAALAEVPADQRQALQSAHDRIRAFHERQLQSSWDYREPDGTRLGQRVTALERVGLYVPGGKAAYPSSVLMNAVPAKVAGVREIVMVSPNPSPMVLAAAVCISQIFARDRIEDTCLPWRSNGSTNATNSSVRHIHQRRCATASRAVPSPVATYRWTPATSA